MGGGRSISMSSYSGCLWQLLQRLSGSVSDVCESVLLLESECDESESDASASCDDFVRE